MSTLVWAEAVTPTEGASLAATLFWQTFGCDAQGVWSAPGRVNLIGEHVDYNGGPCVPMALPHCAYVALRVRRDRRVRLMSDRDPSAVELLDLDTIGPRGGSGDVGGRWGAYLAGVAWALERAGYGPMPGFDAALWSCVPVGAGLSSSAALGCATALALDDVCALGLAGSSEDPNDQGRRVLADAARLAENLIAGANTGGLDQAASLRCRRGHALVLDCRDMSARHVPCDLGAAGLELVVIDTRVHHSLADGHYGSRRADCEEAARLLRVDRLVEVTDIDEAGARLDNERLAGRVRHVVSEIARTRAFVELLDEGVLEGPRLGVAGALMDDSHDSLRLDYEVSCPELDVAVEVARAAGAHGARMTGGGFGGSAIALVDAVSVSDIAAAVAAEYARRGWRRPRFIRAVAGDCGGRVR